MKALTCTSCGASDWKEESIYRICLRCGTKFRKSADEIPRYSPGYPKRPYVPVNSEIALDSDVARLLQKCRTDPANARKYANLVLDIDPTNQEALSFLGRRR